MFPINCDENGANQNLVLDTPLRKWNETTTIALIVFLFNVSLSVHLTTLSIMLSKEENWLNILAIKGLQRTHVIPAHVDTESGKIRIIKCNKVWGTWLAYLAAVQFHSFSDLFVVAKLLKDGVRVTKWALPYHFYKICVPQAVTLLSVVSFVIQPDVLTALLNNSICNRENERGRWGRLKRHVRAEKKTTRKFAELSYGEMLPQ